MNAALAIISNNAEVNNEADAAIDNPSDVGNEDAIDQDPTDLNQDTDSLPANDGDHEREDND